MDIQKEHKSREAFESLWIQSNGHFKYFVFSQEHGKYIHTGVRDNLTDRELLCASITLNTAYLFFIGGVKTQAIPEGFVLVPKELSDGAADNLALNQWEVNKTLLLFQYSDLNTFEFEEVRLNYCKNMANKFKVDYKTMIKAAEGK